VHGAAPISRNIYCFGIGCYVTVHQQEANEKKVSRSMADVHYPAVAGFRNINAVGSVFSWLFKDALSIQTL
jgi:hypothetical protein